MKTRSIIAIRIALLLFLIFVSAAVFGPMIARSIEKRRAEWTKVFARQLRTNPELVRVDWEKGDTIAFARLDERDIYGKPPKKFAHEAKLDRSVVGESVGSNNIVEVDGEPFHPN